MISLTNSTVQSSELTRIIVPANGSASSVDKVNHLAFSSTISDNSGTIWKDKNTIIFMYTTGGLTYFDFIEISN
jgi:hypothetical protein